MGQLRETCFGDFQMLAGLPAMVKPICEDCPFLGIKCGIAWRRFLVGFWLAQETGFFKEGTQDFVRVGQTASEW